LNLICQRWLGHAQPFGGTPEMLLLGNSEKQPQMADEAKVDHGTLISSGYRSISQTVLDVLTMLAQHALHY
jgi:hypothetical protein